MVKVKFLTSLLYVSFMVSSMHALLESAGNMSPVNFGDSVMLNTSKDTLSGNISWYCVNGTKYVHQLTCDKNCTHFNPNMTFSISDDNTRIFLDVAVLKEGCETWMINSTGSGSSLSKELLVNMFVPTVATTVTTVNMTEVPTTMETMNTTSGGFNVKASFLLLTMFNVLY